MNNRESFEINAGSMADIAFLLLIFFIVATTIDVDQGIPRKLPPASEITRVVINERNTFVLLVNRNNELLVQNQKMNISDLKKSAKEFIENPYNDEHLPDKFEMNVPYIGVISVTKNHIISLQNDRNTSYSAYISVQNELTAAYHELRNELSLKRFKISYSKLDEKRKDAIDMVYPLRISEAEPF